MTLAKGVNGSAFLPNVSARDVDTRVRIATDKLAAGASPFAYLAVRGVSATSEYRAFLRFNPNRSLQVRATKLINNVETQLGTLTTVPGVTHTANSYVWLRLQASGTNPTTLRVKAWADGQAEPATWLVQVTDTTLSLQAAGPVGLRVLMPTTVTNGPIRFSFDDYLVTEPQR